MRFRQIHLDFHTSERIPGIGSRFDAKAFKDQPSEQNSPTDGGSFGAVFEPYFARSL